MEDDPRAPEEVSDTVAWSAEEPLRPAALGPSAEPDKADTAGGAAAPMPGGEPRTLAEALSGLAVRFDALVSSGTRLGRVVAVDLADYARDLDETEKAVGAGLQRYRDAYASVLQPFTDLVGDDPGVLDVAERTLAEMEAAARDAAHEVERSARQQRAMIAASEDAASRARWALRWLGERLLAHLADLEAQVASSTAHHGAEARSGSIFQQGDEARALAACREAVRRSLDRLEAFGSTVGAPGEDGRDGLSEGRVERRIAGQLEELLAEIRTLRAESRETAEEVLADVARELTGLGNEVHQASGRLLEEIHGQGEDHSQALADLIRDVEDHVVGAVGTTRDEIERRQAEADPELRAELSRIAEELQAIRRRTALRARARTVAVLDEGQIRDIAAGVTRMLRSGQRQGTGGRSDAAPGASRPKPGVPAKRARRPLRRAQDRRGRPPPD